MAQPPSFSSNNPFRRKASVPYAAAGPPGVPPFDTVDTASPTFETTPALPPADRFRNQLQALAHPAEPPPATSFQKPKVVKKVRVQSPPPSSPESSGIPDRSPPGHQDDNESDNSDDSDEQVDPFAYTSPTGSTDASDRGDEHRPTPSTRPPPNPFQKNLWDLDMAVTETTQHPGVVTGSKAPLDVGAFGRLLLTGQIDASGSSAPYTQHTRYPPSPVGEGGSTTDTSSTSRQSIADTPQAVQETPRTSRETSEQEADDEQRGLVSSSQPVSQPAPSTLKKKPPPPSSRHGKLINPVPGGEGGSKQPLPSPARRAATVPVTSPSRQKPATPSDVNKPLPPAPHRSPAEEDAESVFDREAAGKVPEPEIASGLNIVMPPRPPTPPNASHATSSAPAATLQHQAPKKPAPPPRRQPHGRSESRVTSSPASVVQRDDPDGPLRRSSLDSTRSRSSSVRVNIHAPAPPPPRRPSHQSRVSSSFVPPPPPPPPDPCLVSEPLSMSSPSSVPPAPLMSDRPSSSSSGREARTGVVDHPQRAAKTIPPPPPPARNASVRAKRPVSGSMPSSDAGLSRRSSRGKEGPTPPPPPRHRGSSRASLEGVGTAGVATLEVAPTHNAAAVARNGDLESGGTATVMASEEPPAPSAAVDILADLTALQREVDALRGQYEKAGAGQAPSG
ncbi:hypothetical protein C8A03DRAFT_10988 [Achaetomium macrosporum]|uniref:Uncharacterized protein n=1 Tax=Achaetomium macrosporum TaxID=79813 RepID=A0AAN7CIT8_9PEZI|nr:hypothetical protein C8A03DRAFT_10988 [Achaetomium macrosporum]